MVNGRQPLDLPGGRLNVALVTIDASTVAKATVASIAIQLRFLAGSLTADMSPQWLLFREIGPPIKCKAAAVRSRSAAAARDDGGQQRKWLECESIVVRNAGLQS